jgi:ribosome maturation factor RimP
MAERDRAGSRASARTDRRGGGERRTRGDAARSQAARGDAAIGEPFDPAAYRARLRALIAPVVEKAGYDLEDLVVSRAGRRHLLRVVVDADGGVSLDGVADLSRDISAALDEHEEAGGSFTAGEYVLEVGSPGVDRPLTQPRQWRRNIGRLVAVTAADHRLTGRVTAADDQGVTLDVDGQRREFGYPELGPGRVQIEFGRLDELGDDETDEFEEIGDGEPADLEEREEDEE